MQNNILLISILVPLMAGLAVLVIPRRWRGAGGSIALLALLTNVFIALLTFSRELSCSVPWGGFGIDLSLRLYPFSAFIITATAILSFLITIFSAPFLYKKDYAKFFYAYLLASVSFVIGAVLSDNLIMLLFFWEGLLATTFGMIAIGNKNAFKTATKALIILGLSDLCLMVGIAMAVHLSGTSAISGIKLSAAGTGAVAFIFLMIGAISKGGSMPFHSWIPDAATDAPLPFMAIFPAALEKLISIYLLTRICIDMFTVDPASWLSYTMMTVGAVTIVFAVMMALIQKDFKRLLSYHAISQLGYMILGVGTLTPVGIVGGLFHMINNAMYKSCLFMTGGAVEKEAGTTNLEKLGGIGKRMPVTFACFILTALAISGVPPFNGFFSKELVYDGALERGTIFYLAAVMGSFFTAASFLKLGHAAFLGKLSEANRGVREAGLPMLVPMIIIAAGCLLFGIFSAFPLNAFIEPSVGEGVLEGSTFAGFPMNTLLVWITVAVLIAALLNHIYGVRKTGRALGAVDHIHYAPVLSGIYAAAEKGHLDPYNIWWTLIDIVSAAMSRTDRAIDWIYNVLAVKVANGIALGIKKANNGSYKTYIVWSLAAAGAIIIFIMRKGA